MQASTASLPDRLRSLRDWAVLLTGVASLAFAVLASSTGLVSASDDTKTAVLAAE